MILLNRHNLQASAEQRACETSPPGPDLQYRLAHHRIESIDDPSENLRIAEKMLPERGVPSQTLSKTSVRSSLAGAPPVNAAMSVNTASSMWRAGRARRFAIWLSTRGSPKRSPVG